MKDLATIDNAMRGALEVHEDSDRYKKRFTIPGSSGRVYMVSFDTAGPYWTCSCPGNIRHGQCKHLTAMGLKGRRFGKANSENLRFLEVLS